MVMSTNLNPALGYALANATVSAAMAAEGLVGRGDEQAAEEAGIALRQIGAVGMAVPGHIDQRTGNTKWSPNFGDGFLGKMLGSNGRSVIRGGFRMTYDRIGSQLAANFDLNSALGYTSGLTIGANTFNVSDSLNVSLSYLISAALVQFFALRLDHDEEVSA